MLLQCRAFGADWTPVTVRNWCVAWNRFRQRLKTPVCKLHTESANCIRIYCPLNGAHSSSPLECHKPRLNSCLVNFSMLFQSVRKLQHFPRLIWFTIVCSSRAVERWIARAPGAARCGRLLVVHLPARPNARCEGSTACKLCAARCPCNPSTPRERTGY